jgi:HEAT repeat protein
MKDQLFQEKLKSILSNTPLEVYSQFKQSIDIVLRSGVCSFDDMLTVLQNQTIDTDTRLAICWLLGQFRNKRAVMALLSVFHDHNSQLRRQSAHSLGIIKSKRAVRPLITILQESDNTDIRSDAAYALGHIGDERAVDQLLNTLKNTSEDAKVRGKAAEALAYINSRDIRIRNTLIVSLADSSVEVRFWSTFALGEIGETHDSQSIQELERLAATDTSVLPGWWSVKQEATTALDSIRTRNG